MEITGKIINVLEPRGGVSQRTGNSWKSQEYVIETIEQYPKRCVFNVFGEDNINRFNIQIGQELTVSFDINAREWQGRWFNDIRAWNVQPAQAAAVPQQVPGEMPPFADPAPMAPVQNAQAAPVQNMASIQAAPIQAAPTQAAPASVDPFASDAAAEGSTDNLPF